VDGFYTHNFKCFLPRHAEVDRRLIHVEDVTPVAKWAQDECAYLVHVVQCLRRDLLRLALCLVRPHTIHERVGAHESLHITAPSNKVLPIELGGEGQGLNNEIECVYAHALLAMLEDVPEQELFKRLQLPKRSSVSRLPLAL